MMLIFNSRKTLREYSRFEILSKIDIRVSSFILIFKVVCHGSANKKHSCKLNS